MKYNDSEGWEQLKRKYSLQRSINKGTLTTKLHLESQQRHELGHPRYDKYVAKNKTKGRPTPSYITTDMETLQKIVDDNYLSGVINRKRPGQALIEVEIDTDKYGVAYDRFGKNPTATNRYKIHMSKAKTHIVPMHPTEGK
ncbi:TPA: polymorphic toxin type 50 domain-containing protein [Enterococcus faecalis]